MTLARHLHHSKLSKLLSFFCYARTYQNHRFNDGKYRAKNSVDRVIKSWSGEYKLIASLKFKLCSTADLFALGFRGVPSYHASSQPNMAERHGSGYHSDGSEAPSLKSDNKDLIIKASASDNSSALIEGVAPAATAKLRPVNNAQFTTTNGFHAPQPSTTSGYRQMMGPLPKFERSCESSSSISSGRACPPSWLQPELHYATQTGYNALHRENLKSRPQGEEVGDISNFKHRNKATVLHGLKESPAHKAWLDTLLIRPDNQEEGFKSPSPPYNKISQLQPADKEKNNNPDEPSVEDELLRLLNQDRSYQAQYSQHGNSSQLQTTAEKLNTPHEKWPSHRASEEKATELPRPSSPPRAHNRTPLLPLSQMTKSNPSIEADRQSTQKQFARFPLEQRTDMARDIPQDPQRHLKTIDQSNEPVDAQNLNLASNPNMEASFVSKTAEPLAMETQTISNHISDIPLASATKDLAENPKGYIPARKPSITSADISTSVPADSISDVSCTNKVQTGSASPQNTPIASQGISTPVIASQSLVQHASKPTESLLSTDNNKIEIQVTSSVIPIEPAKMSGQQVATSQPSGSGKDVFIAESKILQTHAPEKRKVDSMSDKVDLPDSSNGSRKTSTSPALRKSQDSEREFKVAQARIATAQRQKVELANALESIMFSEKVWNPFRCRSTAVTNLITKTKKLNQEAEQIEKDNLEMQVRVTFIFLHFHILI